MKKIVISLVLEETEENLNEIQIEILKYFGRAIKGFNVSEIPEPKKEVQPPSFMCDKGCGTRKHYLQ